MLMIHAFRYLCVIFCLSLVVFNAGCAENFEDHVGSNGTGTAVFGLVWLEEYAEKEIDRSVRDIDNPTIDCTSKGIDTITVEVYNGTLDDYLTGKTFPCARGEGTVDNIPVGQDRLFVVTANDFFGNAIYQGEKADVAILGGDTPTDVGYIEMWPLNSSPPEVYIDQSSPIALDYDETSALITGTITAEAALKAVTIRVTEGSTLVSNKIYEAPFDAAPIIYDDEQQYVINLDLDDIAADTTVIFSAVDNFDQPCDEIEVRIHPAVKIQLKSFKIILGAQGNDHGAAASLTHQKVYLVSSPEGAARHSSDVDIYYYSAAPDWYETLYAPDSTALHSETTGLSWIRDAEWDFYRKTQLDHTALFPSDFDKVVYAHQLPDVPDPRSDHAENLKAGDVLAFKTESGHQGIIKVTKLSKGAQGYIELVIKVAP